MGETSGSLEPAHTGERASGHRGFVGSASHFDLSGGLQFGLLVMLGLREQHTLLDIGCGSLRGGKLFIPYLESGSYFGLEPEKWLIEEGVRSELSPDLVGRKQPVFRHETDFGLTRFGRRFDFLLAQSIFSHAAPHQIRHCLEQARAVLEPEGVFAATFFAGRRSDEVDDWVYPGTVRYRPSDLLGLVDEAGLSGRQIDWPHADGQSWIVITHPGRRADLHRGRHRVLSGGQLLKRSARRLEDIRRNRSD